MMMNKKEVEAYRRVHAPSDLKEKIVQTANQRHSEKHWQLSKALGLAMCALLCFGGFVSMRQQAHHVMVYYQGVEVNEDPIEVMADVMPLSHERDVALISVELTIEVDEMTQVSVSAGTLKSYDHHAQLLDDGEEIQIEGKGLILWRLNEPAKSMQMVVQNQTSTQRFELLYEENTQKWILQKMK